MFLWGLVCVIGALAWFAVSSIPTMSQINGAASSAKQLPQMQVLRLLVKEPAVILVLAMSVGVFPIETHRNSCFLYRPYRDAIK